MTELVTVTGKFLDPQKRPLKGYITIEPQPSYVAAPDEDTLFAGPTKAQLSPTGDYSATVIATEGWKYKVTFALETHDGLRAPIPEQYIALPVGEPLPDILQLAGEPGTPRPVFVYNEYLPGEVRVSGAQPDPNDPLGAILVPAAS